MTCDSAQAAIRAHLIIERVRAAASGTIRMDEKDLFDAIDGTTTETHDPDHAHDKRIAPLTAREMEVLEHLTQGDTDKEIAYDLSPKISTVRSLTQRIFRKLKVNNRTQAALWAEKHRLFRDPE